MAAVPTFMRAISGGDGLLRILTAILLLGCLFCPTFAQQTSIVKQVIVRGNELINRETILLAMSTKERAPFLQSQLAADERAIKDLGFFQDAKVLSREAGANEYEVIVEVTENPVVKEIRVAGNTVVPTGKILAVVTQPVGQVLNLRQVRPTLDAVSKLYEDRGYFAQADFVPLKESPGTFNLVVTEQTVNNIVIEGLGRTRPNVVLRLLKTKPGEAFNEQKWAVDRRRLDSTQWFESINGKTQPTDELGKFDLLLDVKETRTAQVGFGLALDPQSRLAGSIRYYDTNFRGSGQTIGFNLQQFTSGGGLSAELSYQNPYIDSRGTTVGGRIFSRVNSYFGSNLFGGTSSPNDDRFDERRTGASFAITKPFREVFATTIGATVESIKTINLRTTGAGNFIQQDGDLVQLNLAILRDRRDVPLDPQRGDYARFQLEPAFSNITKVGGNLSNEPGLLGKHTYLRSTLEYKAFFSRRPKRGEEDKLRPVVAFRARYGNIAGTPPFFEQLFVGGSDSLRGYQDQRFWGKQSLLSSVEYRYPIQKTFTLIGFADYGGAWGGYGSINNFVQSRRPDFHLGYGAGIGFRTPLGSIRIDFAFNQEGGSRTHFSIGGSF